MSVSVISRLDLGFLVLHFPVNEKYACDRNNTRCVPKFKNSVRPSNVMTTKLFKLLIDITCLTVFFPALTNTYSKKLLPISCATSDRDGHYLVEVQIIPNVDFFIDFMTITKYSDQNASKLKYHSLSIYLCCLRIYLCCTFPVSLAFPQLCLYPPQTKFGWYIGITLFVRPSMYIVSATPPKPLIEFL